ncbi:MAG: carbohydrate kinase family protein [Candidatus Babeliales bacterium]
MTKKKRILTIGGATEDIFLDYQQAQTMLINTKQGQRSCLVLEEGAKLEINQLTYTTGGGATNSATSFERQGFDVTACCKLGLDVQGQYIKEQLITNNIDTKAVSFHETIPTGLSCIIKAPSGNHTILAYRGANTTLKASDIPFDMFKNMDLLYVTSLSGESSKQLGVIIEKALAAKVPVALNPGASQLASCTKGLCTALYGIDILILNADEAKTFLYALMQSDENLKKELTQKAPGITNIGELSQESMYKDMHFTIERYFKIILSRGTRVAVVTNGAEGVYVATKDTMYFHKSLPATVINTVGAGDAFGSTFVGSLAADYSLEEAIVRGILNAVSVISSLNAKDGLLNARELDQRLKDVGIAGISTFLL